MRLAIEGLLLFAFIPLVLFLYLRLPLGPGLSLAVGVALMFGHRYAAGPWMAEHRGERCLWCGRTGAVRLPIEIGAGGRTWTMAACGDAHRSRLGRFFTALHRGRQWIALGIFVPLAILLGGTLADALGHPLLPHPSNVLQFQVLVALTVVLASIAWLPVKRPDTPLRCPFPLHNLFLLGVGNTLWVFRLVGAWWLIAGGLRLAGLSR